MRGSPAYFQRVMYDVFGMIRQLGLPTWFLTLSAADMQWPDVIQTIARQYGTVLSAEDIKSMSFEQWRRSIGARVDHGPLNISRRCPDFVCIYCVRQGGRVCIYRLAPAVLKAQRRH